jgi:hypothetical protein
MKGKRRGDRKGRGKGEARGRGKRISQRLVKKRRNPFTVFNFEPLPALLKRIAEVADLKGLPCTITPEEVRRRKK